VPGHFDEPDVGPRLRIRTFAVRPAEVDNWRRDGVPFLPRTGQRRSGWRAQIALKLRPVPRSILGQQLRNVVANRLAIMRAAKARRAAVHDDGHVSGQGRAAHRRAFRPRSSPGHARLRGRRLRASCPRVIRCDLALFVRDGALNARRSESIRSLIGGGAPTTVQSTTLPSAGPGHRDAAGGTA